MNSTLAGGPRSTRNHFVEPMGLTTRIYNLLPSGARSALSGLRARSEVATDTYTRDIRRNRRCGWLRSCLGVLFSVQTVLILVWIYTLRWGERTVFRDSIELCDWGLWEKWPQRSLPHRVVFIADPQLVDPHTYPGRPWPLSSLTVFYADLYLYRTYSLLQQNLRPDSTFFLGDLFDGGREWGTASSKSADPQFKSYGNKVWMKEYKRFVKLFYDTFPLGGADSEASPRGRKIISSLPGNHDLGFGNGIQKPVVDRFQSFFGPSNRIDVLGNHTFVSVDTVSLSARDQPDPATGASRGGTSENPEVEEIWTAADNFLKNLHALKAKATNEELRELKGKAEHKLSPHEVVDASEPVKNVVVPEAQDAEFPTIILTHVPLYRAAGTPCGPLRERYPPSSTNPLPEKDERNALKLQHGYQYQNVLTETISRDIVTQAGPGVTQIYSGDDHDYCEVNHREFSGSPKEITVKSMSLAMGVRRPGFQMASLYNPIDIDTGKTISPTSAATIQNNLCLLPDQVSIFVQYSYVFVFTILVLLIRTLAISFRRPEKSSSEPLLPLSQRVPDGLPSSSTSSTSTSTSSPAQSESRFASRGFTSATSRTASNSPPSDATRTAKHVRFLSTSSNEDWDTLEKSKDKVPWATTNGGSAGVPRRGIIYTFRTEFVRPLKRIAIVSFAFYLWLVWTW